MVANLQSTPVILSIDQLNHWWTLEISHKREMAVIWSKVKHEMWERKPKSKQHEIYCMNTCQTYAALYLD